MPTAAVAWIGFHRRLSVCFFSDDILQTDAAMITKLDTQNNVPRSVMETHLFWGQKVKVTTSSTTTTTTTVYNHFAFGFRTWEAAVSGLNDVSGLTMARVHGAGHLGRVHAAVRSTVALYYHHLVIWRSIHAPTVVVNVRRARDLGGGM